MSSKSNISLCSDTLGHLLWEPWWLKLMYRAPWHCQILHETPWFPPHLFLTCYIHTLHNIHEPNMQTQMISRRWVLDPFFEFPEFFSALYLHHSTMLYVPPFYGSIMLFSILNLLTWSPTMILVLYFTGMIIIQAYNRLNLVCRAVCVYRHTYRCREHEEWELKKSLFARLMDLWESYLSLSVNWVPSSQQKGAHFISTISADT